MNLIWQTLFIFIGGSLLLRLSGRKTISEMTMSQTIIILMLGTLFVQPIASKGIWTTFGISSLLLAALGLTEFIQLKSKRLKNIISGKAVSLIENGILQEHNMKKMRLTIDQLEERLRQKGILSIADVQTAYLEINGELGYQLKPSKQPATKEDIQHLIHLFQNHKQQFKQNKPEENILNEVIIQQNQHTKIPYLQ